MQYLLIAITLLIIILIFLLSTSLSLKDEVADLKSTANIEKAILKKALEKVADYNSKIAKITVDDVEEYVAAPSPSAKRVLLRLKIKNYNNCYLDLKIRNSYIRLKPTGGNFFEATTQSIEHDWFRKAFLKKLDVTDSETTKLIVYENGDIYKKIN